MATLITGKMDELLKNTLAECERLTVNIEQAASDPVPSDLYETALAAYRADRRTVTHNLRWAEANGCDAKRLGKFRKLDERCLCAYSMLIERAAN